MIYSDIIRRSEAIDNLVKQQQLTNSVVRRVLMQTKSVDAVSREVLDQIRWERDIAIEQLKEHGIPFGGIAPDVVEVVRCKDCKYRIEDKDFVHGHYCVKRPHNGGYFCDDGDFCSYGKRRVDDGK